MTLTHHTHVPNLQKCIHSNLTYCVLESELNEEVGYENDLDGTLSYPQTLPISTYVPFTISITRKTLSCLIPRDDIFTNYAESVFLWIKSSREKQKKPTCFISGITSSHAWIPFLDLVDESVFHLNCLKWVFCYTCPNLSWLIWKKISSCQI